MVWINGFGWEVVSTYDRTDLVREDGVVTLGVTDRSERRIYVYAGLRGHMLRKVLMHELAHAFMFSYGVVVPPQYEEEFCGFFDSYAEDVIAMANKLYYDNNIAIK